MTKTSNFGRLGTCLAMGSEQLTLMVWNLSRGYLLNVSQTVPPISRREQFAAVSLDPVSM
jgi:hypothetical protein